MPAVPAYEKLNDGLIQKHFYPPKTQQILDELIFILFNDQLTKLGQFRGKQLNVGRQKLASK